MQKNAVVILIMKTIYPYRFIPAAAVLCGILLSFTACFDDGGEAGIAAGTTRPAVYPDYAGVISSLDSIHKANDSITRRESAGTSVSGRAITALVITDDPSSFEDEPSVRLCGGIHGNEYISCELLLMLAEYLTDEYHNNNTVVKNLVDNRSITIVPLLNPDGWENNSRYNSNGVDLNRNYSVNWTGGSYHGEYAFSEKESSTFSAYCLERNFHLSATFHAGSVVVNMPFDYGGLPLEKSLVQSLACVYSTSGTYLSTPGMLTDTDVSQGTIWGTEWYVVNGSLQDWSYAATGCMDLTIEVAETSPETQGDIDEYFQYNRESMLAYIDAAGRGVSGHVKDGSGNSVSGVKITLVSPAGDIVVKTDAFGYYHRILLPGEYTLRFSATGYKTVDEAVTVPDTGSVTLPDITLSVSG